MARSRDDSPLQSASHLGERLRAARETAGLSTRVAARRLQEAGFRVSHTTVANYELGKTLPSMALVQAFARTYERTVDWFLARSVLLTGVRYRCLKSVRVAEKKRFEGHALGWLQAYLYVEKLMLRQHANLRLRVRIDETPEQLATRIRKKYKLDTFPIPSVIRLLENFGIRVIQIESEARIDGLAAWLGKIPVVALNSRLSNDRLRLNAAHELTHHFYDDCEAEGKLSEDEIERRAFECASHLLIPEKQLRQAFELKSMVRLVQYKERFGISLAAMIYRARRSNLLPKQLYERLWRDFSKLGWRKDEPGYVPPDRPIRMEALIDAALRENKTTYADIARIAGVDERSVRKRVFQAMGGSSNEYEDDSGPSIVNYQAYRNRYDL